MTYTLDVASAIGAALVFAVLARPVFFSTAFLAAAFVNPSIVPVLREYGAFSIRSVDLMLLWLSVGLIARAPGPTRLPNLRILLAILAPFFPFLLYGAASLLFVEASFPETFLVSLASYMRLLATVFFAVLLYLSLRTDRDQRAFHAALLVCLVASVSVAVVEALATTGLGVLREGARFGGVLGVVPTGLLAGLLVLYGLLLAEARAGQLWWWSACLVLLGIGGLIVTKSVSSITATILVSTFLLAQVSLRRHPLHKMLVIVLALITATVIPLVGLVLLRGTDVIGLLSLTGGSFAQRVASAYTSLRIFLQHPVFGIGWQASVQLLAHVSQLPLYGDIGLRFSELPAHYLSGEGLAGHNMYLQILAELGLIGSGLFVCGGILSARAIMRGMRRLPHGSPHRVQARFYVLILCFLLIWWNTMPLIGGQIETVLAFSMMGLLGAIFRVGLLASATRNES